jgi:hypothetical protein
MRLFRSEEHVRRDYAEPGAVFPAAQLWRLARAWYGDRLDPGWEPAGADGLGAALAEAGLTGPFWRLG